jgi:hypothetical protein
MAQTFLFELLNQLRNPVSKFLLLWSVLSVGIVILDIARGIPANTAVFVGSMLSIVGTSFILFSASQADKQERNVMLFFQ